MAKPYAFDASGMQQEHLLTKDKSLTQIGDIIRVPVGALGIVNIGGGADGWIDIPPCNGISLEKNVAQPASPASMVSSSATARVMVQFNRPDYPWIAFSLIQNSLDRATATGTIYRMRCSVQTADGAGGASFYFVTLTAFGLSSTGFTGGSSAQGGYQPARTG